MKLTKTEEDICSYTGTFGILITLTCVIQLFIYALNHWLNSVFLVTYVFIIVCYFFLAFQKHSAPILMIITAVLSLLLALTYWIAGVISAIVIVLFLYSATVTFVIFMDGLHLKLKQKELERRAEEAQWRGKI